MHLRRDHLRHFSRRRAFSRHTPGMPKETIQVKVTAGAKTESVEQIAEGSYKVKVRAKAEKGLANARVRELLAEHFSVSKSAVVLVRGASHKEKLFEIHTVDS